MSGRIQASQSSDAPWPAWQAVSSLRADWQFDPLLIQDLRHEGLYQVKGIKPEGEKVMRLQAQTPRIENGRVPFAEGIPWLADFIVELTSFPKAHHDDQVDSTLQALAYVSQMTCGNSMGLFEFYREEFQKRREAEYILDT